MIVFWQKKIRKKIEITKKKSLRNFCKWKGLLVMPSFWSSAIYLMFLTQSLHPLSFWYSETSIGLTLHSAQYGTILLGMKKKNHGHNDRRPFLALMRAFDWWVIRQPFWKFIKKFNLFWPPISPLQLLLRSAQADFLLY